MNSRASIAGFVLFAALLGVIAAAAPRPSFETDRATYVAVGQNGIVPDCSDLHCFRVLVAWTLEQLPGSSIVKWKAYAAMANAAAAIALARLCLILGLSKREAVLSAVIAAFGATPLYTLFDPYSSDPLMFLLGPLLIGDLLLGHLARPVSIAAVGVFAKEFAAAPLWVFTIWSALQRQWRVSVRVGVAALAVTLVWIAFHVSLMILFNYGYGQSASADLFGGGYLARWLNFISPRLAILSVIGEFGALWLLAAAGLWLSGRSLRLLAVASLPALLALAYVQQPDRALWNFHFVVIPLAVIVLSRLPNVWCAAFAVCFAAVNVRTGAQIPFAPRAAVPLALSFVVALAAVVLALRSPKSPSREVAEVSGRPLGKSVMIAVAAELAVAAVLAALAIDLAFHHRLETGYGLNAWGFRGTTRISKPPQGYRVAVLGGSAAYGYGVQWTRTFPFFLERTVSEAQSFREAFHGARLDVVNLAMLDDGAGTYDETMNRYAYLRPDIVCVYDGFAAPDERDRPRQSAIFEKTGYLPVLPSMVAGDHFWAPAKPPAPWQALTDAADSGTAVSCVEGSSAYCDAMVRTIDFLADRVRGVLIVTPPYISDAHRRQQQALAALISERYARRPKVRYVDLGNEIDRADAALSQDGVYLTALGNARVAERLTEPVVDLLKRAQPQ